MTNNPCLSYILYIFSLLVLSIGVSLALVKIGEAGQMKARPADIIAIRTELEAAKLNNVKNECTANLCNVSWDDKPGFIPSFTDKLAPLDSKRAALRALASKLGDGTATAAEQRQALRLMAEILGEPE